MILAVQSQKQCWVWQIPSGFTEFVCLFVQAHSLLPLCPFVYNLKKSQNIYIYNLYTNGLHKKTQFYNAHIKKYKIYNLYLQSPVYIYKSTSQLGLQSTIYNF